MLMAPAAKRCRSAQRVAEVPRIWYNWDMNKLVILIAVAALGILPAAAAEKPFVDAVPLAGSKRMEAKAALNSRQLLFKVFGS